MPDSQLTQTISQLSHPVRRSVSGLCYSNTPMHRCLPERYRKLFDFFDPSAAAWQKNSNLVPTPVAISVASTPATVSHIQPLVYRPSSPPPTIAASQTALPIDLSGSAIDLRFALASWRMLLARPVLSGSTTVAAATTAASTSTRPRRSGVVSYADPGSGDDIPDAGEVDSDGSDFVVSGGTRTAIRAARITNGTTAYAVGGTPTAKLFAPTKHVDFPEEKLAEQAQRSVALVPIRVEFEMDTHRIRDCFVWNSHELLVTPEQIARTFCADLVLPPAPWADTVAAQIRAQLEDQDGVGSMELAVDEGDRRAGGQSPPARPHQVGLAFRTHTRRVQFTHQLCLDLGLAGEAEPLIVHAVHEELMKHKKDAIEWAVIGGFSMEQAGSAEDGSKDKSGLGVMKDKTGLGLGWGRTPKEGQGPRILRSVWRHWVEAEEFKTRWEMLSQEEVERCEIERERASRQLRRETSKFQSSTRTKRIRY
ncbi:SNF5-domain-containing protein [Lactarius indigo]|nr:SNF5-domain-containing protein [Lactarius indigo]